MMNRITFIVTIAVLCLALCCTCTRENDEPKVIPNAVTDVDGNTYDAVRIGHQVWMKTNLRTKHFRNGKSISYGDVSHMSFSEPCYFEPTLEEIANNVSGYNAGTHGLYYNNSAVMSNDGLCPKGWHVPLPEEWAVLANHNHRRDYSIMKKLASTIGWKEATNEFLPGCHPEQNNTTGFDALPTGYCLFSDRYFGIDLYEGCLTSNHTYVYPIYTYPLYNDFGRGAYWWTAIPQGIAYIGNFQYDNFCLFMGWGASVQAREFPSEMDVLFYDDVNDYYYLEPRANHSYINLFLSYDIHYNAYYGYNSNIDHSKDVAFPVRCIRND